MHDHLRSLLHQQVYDSLPLPYRSFPENPVPLFLAQVSIAIGKV